MAVLYLTQDLMFLSRVAGTGSQLGLAVQGVSSADQLLSAAEDEAAELVIVDLSLPGLDVAAVVQSLRQLPCGGPPTVGYAPHVHVARLDAAREAGCTEVLTRGQFNKQVDKLLQKYCS